MACLPLSFTSPDDRFGGTHSWNPKDTRGYYVGYPFMLIVCLAVLGGCGLMLWRLHPEHKPWAGWLSALPPLALLVWIWQQIGVPGPEAYREQWSWVQSISLDLTFSLDGLGFLFTCIILGIGSVVALYTHYYLHGDPRQGSFYLYLFLFMASMLGIVWADNVLLLFVFWEGTSITSYLLIGHRYTTEASQRAARNALLITGSGGLFMLWGLLLLAATAGSYSLSDLVQAQVDLTQPDITWAMLLILLGVFTKSGQFPFHFWLPGAMAAPTPASAYLHSATMVKAGVFLAARLHPLFSAHPAWFPLLAGAGVITAVLCAVIALFKSDLKAILAYATLTQLGLLFVALGMPGPEAAAATVLGIAAHALYKGPLFLVAGMVEHATSTRDIRSLAGLARPLKIIFAITLLASFSLMGLPVWPGFIAKEYLLEALLHLETASWAWLGPIATAGVLVAGSVFAALALMLTIRVFLRPQPDGAHLTAQVHRPPLSMAVGPLALALLGAVLPFTLATWSRPLFIGGAASILGHAEDMALYAWHGIGLSLGLSVLALLAGGLLFSLQPRMVRWTGRMAFSLPAGETLMEHALHALHRAAGTLTALLQSRSLTTHIAIVLSSAILFVLLAWNRLGMLLDPIMLRIVSESRILPHMEILLALVAVAGALTAVIAREYLTPIIALSVVGLVVTLWFVLFAAPDLALTQLLVEVLLFVLIILILAKLPVTRPPRLSSPAHLRNILLALGMGLFGFVLVILTAGNPYFTPVSEELLRVAPLGSHGGANVVNVILVDFRGFDTFGEMTVIAIAGLGVFSLVRAYHLILRQSRNDHPVRPKED